MFIELVTAVSFGPFAGSKLELAPGMNVIVGRNESGKSTWHAALYAALAGRRRARGRPSPEDADFRAHHRPWNRDSWVVSAVVRLDDGRRVEIRQDLDGKVDCRATDLAIGRDVSNEIMFDGSPDASRWVGLNRRTFASTACVSQAALLSVLEHADGLQEHLQRAAATAGTDATAGAALDAIKDYVRDYIGSEYTNSTKPLRRAIDTLAAAERKRDTARREHAEYLALLEEADEAQTLARRLESEANEGHWRVEALSLALSSRQTADRDAASARSAREEHARRETALAELSARYQRAAELTAALPEGDAGHGTLDEQVVRVAGLLADWRNSPSPAILEGPSAETIHVELSALPEPPVGDAEVHPTVAEARLAWRGATGVRISVEGGRPNPPATGDPFRPVLAAGVGRARSFAATLEAMAPPTDDSANLVAAVAEAEGAHVQAARAHEQARADAEEARRAHRTAVEARDALHARAVREAKPPRGPLAVGLLIALAAVLTIIGVVMLVAGAALLGGLALAFAVAAGAGAIVLRPRAAHVPYGDERAAADGAAAATARRLQATEDASHEAADAMGDTQRRYMLRKTQLDQEHIERERLISQRRTLLEQMERAGLPASVQALRDLAEAAERWQSQDAEWTQWKERMETAESNEGTAAQAVVNALMARGEPRPDDLDGAFSSYEARCHARAKQAADASRRAAVETAYERRLMDERDVVIAEEKRALTEGMLRSIAKDLGVSDSSSAAPAALVNELTAWLEAAQAAAEAEGQRQQQRGELATLLAGQTLDSLKAALSDAEAERAGAAAALERATRGAEASSAEADRAAAIAGLEHASAAVIDAAHEQSGIYWKAAQAAHLRALGAAKTAEGTRAERARSLTPVPDAIETVAAAQSELDRIRSTVAVLDTTTGFLQRAQERVHRDIAPQLARTLGKWLPIVTEGRYTDAIVDPATLRVQVAGSDRQFRQADLLSYGTAEQVYLLLRASLTKHLTAGHDTCPLILDDPTVQADSIRLATILDLLHELSSERQIVVFAQQDEVARWASARLTSPRDRLTRLEQVVLA